MMPKCGGGVCFYIRLIDGASVEHTLLIGPLFKNFGSVANTHLLVLVSRASSHFQFHHSRLALLQSSFSKCQA